jgi:MFS family permease
MFGVHISAAFFTPYMLKDLAWPYHEYAWMVSITVAVKAVVFPLCHGLANRFGLKRVLVVAGAIVTIVPLIWAVSRAMGVLATAQILAGMGWAAYEFASFQLFLDHAGRDHAMAYLAVAGTMTGLAQLGGSLLGGRLLESGWLEYQDVFLLSAGVRALALLVLAGWLRRLPGVPIRKVLFRIGGIRPTGGAGTAPVAAGPPDADDHGKR